jgi:hypothetical protein
MSLNLNRRESNSSSSKNNNSSFIAGCATAGIGTSTGNPKFKIVNLTSPFTETY